MVMPNDEIRATANGTGRRIKIKPEKRFLRLDKPFNDAVRAKKKIGGNECLAPERTFGGTCRPHRHRNPLYGSQGANITEGGHRSRERTLRWGPLVGLGKSRAWVGLSPQPLNCSPSQPSSHP